MNLKRLFKADIWGLYKEKIGAEILITVGYKKYWYSWFSFMNERWFMYNEKDWRELPGFVLVEDLDLIRFLNRLNNELEITYTIK